MSGYRKGPTRPALPSAMLSICQRACAAQAEPAGRRSIQLRLAQRKMLPCIGQCNTGLRLNQQSVLRRGEPQVRGRASLGPSRRKKLAMGVGRRMRPWGWAGVRALFLWSVRLQAVAGQYAGFDPVGAHASQNSLRAIVCWPLPTPERNGWRCRGPSPWKCIRWEPRGRGTTPSRLLCRLTRE